MKDDTSTLLIGLALGAILMILFWPRRRSALAPIALAPNAPPAKVCGAAQSRSGWYRPHGSTQGPRQPPTEF